jgi:hypothetical protein
MNNPYLQNPYQNEGVQHSFGRNRNSQSVSSDNRPGRPTWREDNLRRPRGHSLWDDQTEYSQPRFSPNFDASREGYDWELQGTRQYDDEYGYYSNGEQISRGGRPWAGNEDYANYNNRQQDYSFGNGPYENPSFSKPRSHNYVTGAESSRSERNNRYSDSGNFGFNPRSPASFSNPGLRSTYQDDYARSEFLSKGQLTGAYGLHHASYRGKGPKGYVRTDERIREEICERLSDDPRIDASDVSVEVREGVVTLEGSIQDRGQKYRIEDIADSCSGVKDVQNGLRVALSGSPMQSDASESHTQNSRDTGTSFKPTKQ